MINQAYDKGKLDNTLPGSFQNPTAETWRQMSIPLSIETSNGVRWISQESH